MGFGVVSSRFELSEDFGGAVADRLVVPSADHLLHAAPEDVDPEVLCVLPDNALDAYRAVGPPLASRPSEPCRTR